MSDDEKVVSISRRDRTVKTLLEALSSYQEEGDVDEICVIWTNSEGLVQTCFSHMQQERLVYLLYVLQHDIWKSVTMTEEEE